MDLFHAELLHIKLIFELNRNLTNEFFFILECNHIFVCKHLKIIRNSYFHFYDQAFHKNVIRISLFSQKYCSLISLKWKMFTCITWNFYQTTKQWIEMLHENCYKNKFLLSYCIVNKMKPLYKKKAIKYKLLFFNWDTSKRIKYNFMFLTGKKLFSFSSFKYKLKWFLYYQASKEIWEFLKNVQIIYCNFNKL